VPAPQDSCRGGGGVGRGREGGIDGGRGRDAGGGGGGELPPVEEEPLLVHGNMQQCLQRLFDVLDRTPALERKWPLPSLVPSLLPLLLVMVLPTTGATRVNFLRREGGREGGEGGKGLTNTKQ